MMEHKLNATWHLIAMCYDCMLFMERIGSDDYSRPMFKCKKCGMTSTLYDVSIL